MPLNPLPPRTCRSNPTKYAFSDNESDEDGYSPFSSPDVAAESPLPHPASPSSPSSPYPLPSPCKSHSRKRSPSHIRRPRNAFIIFRSEFCFKQKEASEQNVETDHRQISRIAAYIWRDLSEDEKAEYKRRAEEEKAAHKAAYPDYRYAPIGRPRATVRQKSKRNNNEEIYRCRAVAELYLSGLQGKQPESPAVSLDEKSTYDSLLVDPDTSSSQRSPRRHLSTRKRKEKPRVSLPKQERNCTAVEVPNGLILDHPQSPLSISHNSSPELDPMRNQEIIEPKPIDFMGDVVCKSEPMPPLLQGSIYQDSPMSSSIDELDDFSKFSLYQLLNAADDNSNPSNTELSRFMNVSSLNGFDGDKDFYNAYPDSETCFSTPSETLFSESGSNGTTFFETRLEEREIVDSAFKDDDILAYNKSFEFEEYLDL